jgi:PAS domain-containing protein
VSGQLDKLISEMAIALDDELRRQDPVGAVRVENVLRIPLAEAALKVLLDQDPDHVLDVREDGTWIMCHPLVERLFGSESLFECRYVQDIVGQALPGIGRFVIVSLSERDGLLVKRLP